MRLPTAEEINPPPGDLDGRWAVEHFLGKSLEQAEALFRENSLHYQEDLMFMGAPAFRFYVHAAISYILSCAATDDSDIIHCLAGILEHRLEFGAEELVAVAQPLEFICAYVLRNYDRFDLRPEIYGDLRPRFEGLRRTFSEMIGPPGKR